MARLNAGDPDVLLESYDDEVVVTAPLSGVSDPATDFVLRGKAAYRRYLLAFLEYHRGFDLAGMSVDGDRLTVSIVTRTGEPKTLLITLNAAGLGTHVTILGAG